MSNVAVDDSSGVSPNNKVSIPAIDASAAPIPPGKVETAPMIVENERMKTANDKVDSDFSNPSPINIRYSPIPSPSHEMVPNPTAIRVVLGLNNK